MRLETLGRLELGDSGFGQRQAKLLLAYLALEGRTERSHLAELFWPNARRPLNNLSSAITRLRSVDPSLIEADRSSITAVVEVDADRFGRYLTGGHDEEALSLYNGRFLDGLDLAALPHELQEWVLAHRSMLAAAARDGAARLAEAASQAGAVERATAWAERAIDVGIDAIVEPDLFPTLHRILSLGGSPQALRLAEEAEEFGLSLSAPVAAIEERQPTRPSDADFHGRCDELVAVLDGLAAKRAMVIHGMGGVGKSRLARQAVGRCGNLYGPVSWIDMTPDPGKSTIDVSDVIRATLASHVEQDYGLDGVIEAIGDTPQLIVVDNFEFGVSQVDRLERLVASCPPLRMIVASRIDPEMDGAESLGLQGLPVAGDSEQPSPAVRLLGDALARSHAPLLGDDQEAAQTVCQMLDGLPLAIELVAGWRNILSFEEIIIELESGFKLLEVDDPIHPEHHRCYSTVFDQTWSLLEPSDREVMLRLSAVPGRFRRPLVESVGGADLQSMRRLNRHSLLSCSSDGWFELHPLIVEYTSGRLADAPNLAAKARQSHLDYIIGELSRIESFGFSEGPGALADLEDDGANLMAAWDRAAETNDWVALRLLIDPIDRALGRTGNYGDALRRFDDIEPGRRYEDGHQTATSPREDITDFGYELDMHRVWLMILAGEYPAAKALAEVTAERLALDQRSRDNGPPVHTTVRVELARARAAIDRYEGNATDAAMRLQQVASLVAQDGSRLETLLMEDLGHCQLIEGQYEEAADSYRAALNSVLDRGSTFDVARNHMALATALILHRRPVDALAQLETGQELVDQHNLEQLRVYFSSKRATALLDAGDTSGARVALDLAFTELSQGGEEWLRVELEVTAGRLALVEGDLDRADRHADEIIGLATTIGDTPFLLRGFLLVAEVVFARGELASPSVSELLVCVATHQATDHQDRQVAKQMLEQIAEFLATGRPRLIA